jgi:hypothetical protein
VATTETLEKLVHVLAVRNLANAGVMAAHRAAIDALICTIGTNLPHLLAPLGTYLDGIQKELRGDLVPDSVEAFDNTVGAIQGGIQVLQR